MQIVNRLPRHYVGVYTNLKVLIFCFTESNYPGELYYNEGVKYTEDGFSDEQLVEFVCSKDQSKYEDLVKRYQVKLTKYAYYLIGDHDQALDVVQESFIKAYINLKGFDTSKKFSSWIYRIVHNEVMNLLKKKKPVSLEQNDWLEQIADRSLDLEEMLYKNEITKHINKLLNKLPTAYKEPLILYFLEGYSYEEVSQILKVPIGTVGTKINRGKKLLKEIFLKNRNNLW